MKKLIFIAVLALIMFSCKKQEKTVCTTCVYTATDGFTSTSEPYCSSSDNTVDFINGMYTHNGPSGNWVCSNPQ